MIRDTVVPEMEQDFAIDFSERISDDLFMTDLRVLLDI
ncbi:Uncharacterised protein [Staphylococcus aureus]|nr:Uncharacterised protein [Staphylococcus aureus]